MLHDMGDVFFLSAFVIEKSGVHDTRRLLDDSGGGKGIYTQKNIYGISLILSLRSTDCAHACTHALSQEFVDGRSTISLSGREKNKVGVSVGVNERK